MKELTCFGNSLWPFVKHGQSLRLVEPNAGEVQCGDLIVYCWRRLYVCHRVLFKENYDGTEWYFTKGDAKVDADGWIPHYRLVGKVVSVDGVKLSEWRTRYQSWFLYWSSKIQWVCYETLFLNRFAGWLSQYRFRFIHRQPIFSQLFAHVFSPWWVLRHFGRRA